MYTCIYRLLAGVRQQRWSGGAVAVATTRASVVLICIILYMGITFGVLLACGYWLALILTVALTVGTMVVVATDRTETEC